MRNSLIIILLLLGIALSGFFVVDERQVAIVKYSADKQQVYATGIHWKVPLWGKLTLVYLNVRSSTFNFDKSVVINDNQYMQPQLVFTWQVNKPNQYLKYLDHNSVKEFERQLVLKVRQQVEVLAANSLSLTQFVQQVNLFASWSVAELGVNIVNMGLVSTNLVESQAVTLNTTNQLNAESAYLAAQQIKQQTDQNTTRQLAEIRKQDVSLYNYLIQLRDLERQAKTKQDVPPFAKFYSN